MSNLELEWSKGRKRMIEEQAKEELEALQLLHPNRFDYLKVELKSFIQLLQSQPEQFSHQPNPDDGTSRPLNRPDSQESSSCRKRRKVYEGSGKEKCGVGDELQLQMPEIGVWENRSEKRRRRNRVEMVLERAVVCLRKIRRFKTALFSGA